MRVLIAFDKFKDSLTSEAACQAAAEALRRVQPDWELDLCPFADGGDGFTSILTQAAGGQFRERTVTGPSGKPVRARFGLVTASGLSPAVLEDLGWRPASPGSLLGVVDMASASGLALVPPAERTPWTATTLGTGELMRAATDAGAEGLIVGVGGSATHDLGLGALHWFGYEAADEEDLPIVAVTPIGWSRVTRIVPPSLRHFPRVWIACDVVNPLTGPNGAAAVYGPQKGLKPEEIARLDEGSGRIGRLLAEACKLPQDTLDEPGAGAAGGIAFGLRVALGATLVSGTDLVTRWTRLDERLAKADLLLTGEGRFDESSLQGKGPGALAARAQALGKRVQVFAGSLRGQSPYPAIAITPEATPLAQALADARVNLVRSVAETFL